MTTKKQLEQENKQLRQTINRLKDEIRELSKIDDLQRRTINKLRTIIVILNGPTFFDLGD